MSRRELLAEPNMEGQTKRPRAVRLSLLSAVIAMAFLMAFIVNRAFPIFTRLTPDSASRHDPWRIYPSLEAMLWHDDQSTDDRTVYGSKLEPWQLDTSREYHLSRNGPWNSSQPKTTREYTFTISQVETWPAGVNKTMTLINGKFPGPVIEANVGDRIVVHYVNEATLASTLHFHGMFQNGSNHMDGVQGISQCAIPPGSSFTYDFTVNDQWGTYWYHSHYSTQYLEGIVGPMIIHSPDEDAIFADQYDEDVIIFLSDLYFESSYALIESYLAPEVGNSEPVPDSGLIQGVGRFDCSSLPLDSSYNCSEGPANSEAVIPIHENKTYRFRIVSAGGFSEFDFSIDNHVLTVIEADGTNTKGLELDVLRVANAQRYSVLVDMNQGDISDGFWMRATMNTYCYDSDEMRLDPDLKAVLAYPDLTKSIMTNGGFVGSYPNTTSHKIDNSEGRCLELDESLLEPVIVEAAPDPHTLISLDASFQVRRLQISYGFFNDSTYHHPPNNYSTLKELYYNLDNGNEEVFDETAVTPSWANNDMVVTINEDVVVDVLINNFDDGAHPFHFHGLKFWVLASGQGYFDESMYKNINTTNPIRRDTVQVNGYGWVLVRFMADNPGIWPMHCHILWHTVAGMLMQFSILPGRVAELLRPTEEWFSLCNL